MLHCLLLRLPPCLRQKAFLSTLPPNLIPLQKGHMVNISKQAFSTTFKTLNPTRQTRTSRKPTAAHSSSPPSGTKRRPPPPDPTKPTPKPLPSKPSSYLQSLFQFRDEVLIYRAPPHRSFFITSFIVGSLFLFGAYNYAIIFLRQSPPISAGTDPSGGNNYNNKSKRLPWYLILLYGVPTLFLAVAGTAILLAPANMIKSITALSPVISRTGRPMLRCDAELSPLRLKRLVFEVDTPSEAFLDRQVSVQDFSFYSIPLREATSTLPASPPPQTMAEDGSRGSLLFRAWNTIRLDTRRMFLREGMAYLRFEGRGNWKLDLQRCEMLDQGRALERLTSPDHEAGVGVVAMVRRYLLSR